MIQLLTGLWQMLKRWFSRTHDFGLQGNNERFLLSEEERLRVQLQSAQVKLEQAWHNLQYAEQNYVDIAIVEINLAETEYSLLHHKYRMCAAESHHLNNNLLNLLTLPQYRNLKQEVRG